MKRTADVPAREPGSQVLSKAAGLGVEPRPETLPSGTALLFERIYDSLIPQLEVKEPHRHRIALDTAITLCAERPEACHREPDSPTDARSFPPPCRPCAMLASPAGASDGHVGGVRRCTDFGMVPADLGRASPHDQSTQSMGKSEDARGRDSLHTGVSI